MNAAECSGMERLEKLVAAVSDMNAKAAFRVPYCNYEQKK